MNDLFLNLLRTSLVVGAAAAILTLLSPLWNRRCAAIWKKRLWCLLAALALLGAFARLPEGAARVTVTVPERQVVVSRSAGAGAPRVTVVNPASAAARAAESAPGRTGNSAVRPRRASSVSLLAVAEIVWALGAALVLLRLAAKELSFRRYLRRWAKPPQSQTLTALYARLLGDFPKRRAPELLICPGVGSPMLTGLFRPKLLLPGEDFSQTEAVWLVRHELIHWRSRDLFWKLLLLAANAVHWFNPALWLLRQEAGRDIERACDERVMDGADLPARRAYGAMLLAAAQKGRFPALSTRFSAGRRALKERLRSILEGKKRRGAALAAVAGVLAICAVPLISCAQETAAGRNNAALKAYFRAHYSEKTSGCVYADLTHDGADELVVTEIWKDAGRKTPLPVRDAEKAWDGHPFRRGRITVLRAKSGGSAKAVWSRDLGADGGGYYLYRQNQKDYLFFYNPRRSAGSADYRYRLFSLGADGGERTAAEDRAACPLSSGTAEGAPSEDDRVQTANPSFLHAVSVYLQRAAPLVQIVPVIGGEGVRLGAGWAAYASLYTSFDAEGGDPADAPAPVRAMAHSEMEKQARRWEEQSECNQSTGAALRSKVKITDSRLCALFLRGKTALPGKDGSVQVWEVRYLLKPKNPAGTPVAGGQGLEGGWLLSAQDAGEPLVNVASEHGGYRLLESGNTGTVTESLMGSYSLYASELLRKYYGVRAKTVSFAAGAPEDPTEHPFRLESLDGASCYLPADWKPLSPVRASFLKEYARTEIRQSPDRDGLSVYFLHDRAAAAGEKTARTALKQACLSASNHTQTLRYSNSSGNLDTSSGLVQSVSAVCDAGGRRESNWWAFTVPDGTGGCWAVATRCPYVGTSTPDENWVWCSAITFCPDVGQASPRAAQITVKKGVPYIRYGADADWSKLGEAIAPPREWKDDDLAGRNTAKMLSGDPEISAGLVTAQSGWLAATYGRGVAAADTYVYRTADGGKTWTQTPASPGTPWHLAATDFIDSRRAMVAGRNFSGAPVFYTDDGGAVWRQETLPFSAEPYWETVSLRNTADRVNLMAAYGTTAVGRAVFSLKDGTWETSYEIVRRDGDGTVDILLERGGTVSVVCTLRQGQDYRKPEDVELAAFDGPLGQDGFRLDLFSNNFGWRQSRYYAVRSLPDGGAVQMADSFGATPSSSDFSVDLDGDGIAELVCGDTYEADGVRRVRIFRTAAEGTVETAEAGEDYLADALGLNARDFSSPVSSSYNPDSGKLTFQYTVGAGDRLRSYKTELPLRSGALKYSVYRPGSRSGAAGAA